MPMDLICVNDEADQNPLYFFLQTRRKIRTMADAYSLAEEHLDKCIQEAAGNNIDLNAYGQALIWKLIERYQAAGRPAADIISEIKFMLENIDEDGTFHVSRN